MNGVATAHTPDGVRLKADALHAAGITALPTKQDGSKSPALGTWAQYKTTRPTADEHHRMFGTRSPAGVGVIAGVASGVIGFDFDGPIVFDRFADAAADARLADLVSRICNGYLDGTPGGGRRVLFRVSDLTEFADTTFACDAAGKVLIEQPTHLIVAPSFGGVHPSGRPYTSLCGGVETIATITAHEYEDLCTLARQFDERPAVAYTPRVADTTRHDRPGDDYNARGSWHALLTRHGWRHHRSLGDKEQWTRPGKPSGCSATVNHSGNHTLYVFSPNAHPFEAGRSYSLFFAHALLEHSGDLHAATRALAAEGYGPPAAGREDVTRAGATPVAECPPEPPDEEPAASPLEFVTVRDLAARVAARGPRRFLFRGLWPAGDYGVHAAEKKAGKTWTTCDAGVSVASGTSFLGRFRVDDPGPVLMLAGEGGEANMLRRLRAVAEARGLTAEDLPIVVCARAPHLRDRAHLDALRAQLEALRPRFVSLDPLYLSARGAEMADLYSMGAVLENVQHLCQDVGASLWVATHFNRKEGKGADRILGSGPAEWGRVLLSAGIVSRHSDHVTRATTILTDVEVIGGEVPDLAFRVRRRIWADDPDSLDSPLHVETDIMEPDQTTDSADAAPSLTPAARKLLEALQAQDAPVDQRVLVDAIARAHGHGLKRETVSRELNKLERAGLATKTDMGSFLPAKWEAVTPQCDPRDVTREQARVSVCDPPYKGSHARDHTITREATITRSHEEGPTAVTADLLSAAVRDEARDA